jgi:hypothetical protein
MFFKRLFSSSNLDFIANDGGRAAAGFKGQAGDCVVRSIAIATGMQKSSLSRYFHLEREIPSGTVGKLCAELKVSPEELLKAVGALGWPAKPKRNRG